MKHQLVFGIIIISLCSMGFTANAQSKGKEKTIRDKDGNTYTLQTMPDKLTWLTTNLKVTVPDSYVYYNADTNAVKYGRLYTWQAAQEGCTLLGKGWRVPTDAEWQKLAGFYGGVEGDSKDGGKSAYTALLIGGKSGFNAIWGGRRDADKQYWQLEINGLYWTGTQTDATHAWIYNFTRRGGTLSHHNDAEKDRALSVRCVRK